MTKSINICIADNHPIVLYGLNHFFESTLTFNVISQVQNFDSAVTALRKFHIDVLLIDLELSGLNRMEDLKNSLQFFPKTKFLFYTNLSEERHAVDVIKMGAAGFIPKFSTLNDLEQAIIKVHSNEVVVSDFVQNRLNILASKNKKNLHYKKLSTREIEVLRYLSEGKRNKDIAQILKLDEKTISTYKLRLLDKLAVSNLVDLISRAQSLGIL